MTSVRVQQILSGALETGDGAGLPAALCEAALEALPVTGVGLAVMSEHGTPTGLVAATDQTAKRLEELQFTLGEGPCVDASTWARPALHPDLAVSGLTRWPGFGPAAAQAGIAAVFAFPLQVGGIRLGVLDLYRDAPGELSDRDLTDALAFADAATTVLLHLQDQAPAGGLYPLLDDMSTGRAGVHQATGMIAVQAGVGLAEALLLLRGRAFSAERSIVAVAADVVNRAVRFDREDMQA